MGLNSSSRWIRSVAVIAFAIVCAAMAAAPADAAKVVRSTCGSAGSGAGQLNNATGIAVNSTGAGGVDAGDIYLVDSGNHRVQHMSADCEPIHVFGWDVVASGPNNAAPTNAVQSLVVPGGASGTFALSFNTKSTGPISATATAAEVQSALVALSSIGTGGVAVTGGPGGTAPYIITFAGQLANTPVPELVVDNTNLAGGTASVSVTTEGVSAYEVCDVDGGDTCQSGRNQAASGSGGANGAGGLNAPQGVAVDPANGNVFVTDQGNRRVDVYSATGAFQGAFGWGVSTGSSQLEFCTELCLPGLAGSGAGQFGAALGHPAVDRSTTPHNIYVGSPTNLRFDAFAPVLTGTAVTGVTFLHAVGWDVVASGPSNTGSQLEICRPSGGDVCKAGVSGGGPGQFYNTSGSQNPTSIAVDSTGAVYAVNQSRSFFDLNAMAPTRVTRYTFPSGGVAAEDFAPSELTTTSGSANSFSNYTVAVDPGNDNVLVGKKAGTASSIRFLEFDSAGTLLGISPPPPASLSMATSNTSRGLAIGTEERFYFADGVGNKVSVFGPLPPAEVASPSCEPPTATEVTCSGTVTIPNSESGGISTQYRFEYSGDGVNWTRVPGVDVALGQTPGPIAVEQVIKGLQPSKLYQVRICATTGPTVCSNPTAQITTAGAAPNIALAYVEDVSQHGVTLGAHINPNGSKARYHFEWAEETDWVDSGYNHRTPAFDRSIGGGGDLVVAQDAIEGLQPETAYRFRVVATNATGTATGQDERFETLNECGLINDRCFELVSPADKGPAGIGGDIVTLGNELQFQAAPSGGGLAYVLAYGLPSSTAGNEVLYRALRGSAAWTNEQFSPAVKDPLVSGGGSAVPSATQALADDLDCGVIASTQLLTADAPAATVAADHANLFVRGQDGTYQLITKEAPSNLAIGDAANFEYSLVGMSGDCQRVVFVTKFAYPAVPAEGVVRLYEWDHGELRSAGAVPTGAGLEEAAVTPGAHDGRNWWSALSSDGERLFFTAQRREDGSNAGAGESGKRALFTRIVDEASIEVIDVSQSQTGTPNNGAKFETAAKDGTRVFFTANYGLTGPPPAGGTGSDCTGSGPANRQCDLYEYDFGEPDPEERLRNLSELDHPANQQGAEVAGVLGASSDGSHVYFAARGELDPGHGKSWLENVSAGTYSVYHAHSGELNYVGSVRQGDLEGSAGVLISTSTAGPTNQTAWKSRVTPDGKHLLFASSANVTGYNEGGTIEAYLYSADQGRTSCVSCRRDLAQSVALPSEAPLVSGGEGHFNNLRPPLMLSDDGSHVFFFKRDRLASGAVEGRMNLYEWSDGQIATLAVGPPDGLRPIRFGGASASGEDVFFVTSESLVSEDTDGRKDVYDARAGGGFPPPPPPAPPCDPSQEGSCQPAAAKGEGAVAPASSSVHGSGNVHGANRGEKRKKSKKHRKKGKRQGKKGKRQGKKGKRQGKKGKRQGRKGKTNKRAKNAHQRSARTDRGDR